jgi:hypothetical protein
MEIPLKQAPDRLLDQQKWSEFISHFDTREIALDRLSCPPSDPAGFYREGDAKLVKSGEGRWKQIDELFELGIALVGELKTKLINGRLLSSGISQEFDQNVEREPIASELWAKMWPVFVNDCAAGAMFGFTHVLVRRNAALHGLDPPENLPYGLDVWRGGKKLNIEWSDAGQVVVVSYKAGDWERELERHAAQVGMYATSNHGRSA